MNKHRLYYNSEYNGFHVLYKISDGLATISGCCNFIEDTRTTITRAIVNEQYLKKLIVVDALHLEQHDFIQMHGKYVDSPCALTTLGDKSYLFYRDKHIIRYYYSEQFITY